MSTLILTYFIYAGSFWQDLSISSVKSIAIYNEQKKGLDNGCIKRPFFFGLYMAKIR